MYGILLKNDNNNVHIKFIYKEKPIVLNIPKLENFQVNDPVLVIFTESDNPIVKIDKIKNFESKEVYLLELERKNNDYQALFAAVTGEFITIDHINQNLKEQYIERAKQEKTFMYYNFDGNEYIDF